MADIINLRQARKAKSRKDKEKRAADNRALFGLTKDQKTAAKREQSGQKKDLDGHRLDRSDTPGESNPEEE